ncbi:unnamed protein product [Rangifer tarandus platyrhynchus]|uniref:Uncharacterized protein n=2 Tax=Rangifer tarandus platyrhynchus TaxID=3082113 RepID=A0ACB0FA09_RANTA|nr:unnamed protein product [Rangifer tarandus platyrhynchus]CAI9709323.1 unnamed protein product [Rangifer tarandus platyrhynchus]
MPRRAQSSELARHRHLRGQSLPPRPRNTAITCQNENTATCVYAKTTAITAQRLSGLCPPTPLALTADPCSLTLHAAPRLRACGCLTAPPRLGRLRPLPLRGCCRDAGRQGVSPRLDCFLSLSPSPHFLPYKTAPKPGSACRWNHEGLTGLLFQGRALSRWGVDIHSQLDAGPAEHTLPAAASGILRLPASSLPLCSGSAEEQLCF